LRQERLLLNALQTVLLVGVYLLRLLLDGAHVDGAEMLGGIEILVEGVGRMNGLIFLGGIFALDVCERLK
jgi:hypothetical protein